MEPPPSQYFFAGAASLGEQLDKLVMAVLRDGRLIVGKLMSYDQFGSLMLRDACERHVAGGKCCDLSMPGVYLIRGENLVMLSELDPEVDAAGPGLTRAEWEEVRAAEVAEEEARRAAAVSAGLKGPLLEAAAHSIWTMMD